MLKILINTTLNYVLEVKLIKKSFKSKLEKKLCLKSHLTLPWVYRKIFTEI